MKFEEALLSAPPEPSLKRPDDMLEDYRRWRGYWLAWFKQPSQQQTKES